MRVDTLAAEASSHEYMIKRIMLMSYFKREKWKVVAIKANTPLCLNDNVPTITAIHAIMIGPIDLLLTSRNAAHVMPRLGVAVTDTRTARCKTASCVGVVGDKGDKGDNSSRSSSAYESTISSIRASASGSKQLSLVGGGVLGGVAGGVGTITGVCRDTRVARTVNETTELRADLSRTASITDAGMGGTGGGGLE